MIGRWMDGWKERTINDSLMERPRDRCGWMDEWMNGKKYKKIDGCMEEEERKNDR